MLILEQTEILRPMNSMFKFGETWDNVIQILAHIYFSKEISAAFVIILKSSRGSFRV